MAVAGILRQYKSCSTWRGYKTNSNRFHSFLTQLYSPELTQEQIDAIIKWDISLPPHLPPNALLTDKILSTFALYCINDLHLTRPSFNKMVAWHNEASRDISNLQRREFRATVKVLRSQPWYREYEVKRAKTIPTKYLSIFERYHVTNLDTALPFLVFFLGSYGGARVSDLHTKILLKHIKIHNTTIYGVVKPIVTITLPAENAKGNGGAITFQCSCPGNHDVEALGICNKLCCFQIVHKALLDTVNRYLRKWTAPDGVISFVDTKGTWSYMHWKKWVQGVRLINQVTRDKTNGEIIGFKVGGLRNRGMKKEKITSLYHKALLLVGVQKNKLRSYTFHGLRRTAATIQMEFGDNLPEQEVMKATRHTSTRSFRLYNQESVQKLARHTNRDTEIAYLTGVVCEWRESQKLSADPNPIEVSLLRQAIKSYGLTVHELRTDKHWTSKDVIQLLLRADIKDKKILPKH